MENLKEETFETKSDEGR